MLGKSLYQPNNLTKIFQSNYTAHTAHSYPLASQQISERQIILSILYLLQGFQKYPFWYTQGKGFEMCEKIQTSHLSQSCLKSAVLNMIQAGNILAEIRHKNQILASSVNPQVKTFSQSVLHYIHNSNLFYSNLLTKLHKQAGTIQSTYDKNDPLTIISLHLIVKQKLPLLLIVLKIINNALTSAFNQFVLIINTITDLIDEFSNYPIKEMNQFHELIVPILRHEIILIRDWLVLKDPLKETDFFIRQPLKQQKLSEADSFFNQPNPIYISALPNIFRPSAKSLLQIGKTIRYILLFFNQIQKHELMNYFDIENLFIQILALCDWKPIQQFPQIKKKTLTINSKLKGVKDKKLEHIKIEKDNPYEMFPTVINAFYFHNLTPNPKTINHNTNDIKKDNIQNINVQIQRKLKNIIQVLNQKCFKLFKSGENVPIKDPQKIRRQISNTLKGIKQFMLYSQGDFFQQLMVMIYQTMERPMNMISNNLVNSFIQEAKNISNAKQLPTQILQNVTFFYLNSPQKAQYLKGWHNFSILYKPSHPTNYIFTTKIMECFGQIFNFIFQLKKCELTTKNIWADYKDTSQSSPQLFQIRNSIHCKLNSLMSHIIIQIDVQWVEYSQKIHQSLSIIQIMQHTHKTLGKLRKLTIEQKYLVSSVQALMDIVDQLKKIYAKNQEQKNVIKQEQIQKFRYELRSIAELIMKVQYYKQILDFNQFYTQMIQ